MLQEKILTKIKIIGNLLQHYRPSAKQLWLMVAGAVSLLVIINLVMLWYYQDHYYPNTWAGDVKVGGMTQSRVYQVLADRIDRHPLILSVQGKIVKVSTKDLGAQYNIEQTIADLNRLPKLPIPMLAWFRSNAASTPINYTLHQSTFDQKVSQLINEHTTQPQNAKMEIKNGNVSTIADKPGAEFNTSSVAAVMKEGLGKLAKEPVKIPFQEVQVDVSARELQPIQKQAEQKLATKISLQYNERHFSPSRTEIGSWLEVDDKLQLVVSQAAVSKYVEQIADEIDVATKNEVITTLDGIETGRQPGQSGLSLNRADTVQAILQALVKPQNLEYQLKVDTVEPIVEYVRKYSFSGLTYSYCVQANAVNDDMLNHFSQKITSTLSDSRGWGMGGQIKFSQVNNGCNFNLVLAAASTLPAYSSGCSIYWSCRVGSNVIINVDRWVGASDSWNQAGGSLDEYQSMVINHEVGHWLGFDHWTCGGAGQPAPVMLQQSIDLQGCTFNVWPVAAELGQLKAMKGL
jgi:vancomycin resistance protein YoaR